MAIPAGYINTIGVFNTGYRCDITQFTPLTRYTWYKYSTARNGDEVFSIRIGGTSDRNELASLLMNTEICGPLMFIKLTRTRVTTITMDDLPELAELSLIYSMSEGMTLGSAELPDELPDELSDELSDEELYDAYMDDADRSGYDSL